MSSLTLNITRKVLTYKDFPAYEAARWLWVSGLSVIVVFGTFGNSLTVILLNK